MQIFLYGTLRYPPLLDVVAGPGAVLRPARLADHAVRWAAGQSFPLLTGAPGGVAEGALLEADDPRLRARIDHYEAAFGYRRQAVTVDTDAGPVAAEVYLADDPTWQPGTAFALEDWVPLWGALSVRAAEEIMGFLGLRAPEELGPGFAATRVRAQAWLNARSDSVSNRRRAGRTAADVETLATRRPYRDFFLVEERDLRFRRFDGTMSAPVRRAAFVMADAVTVLPYDPRRDRVLMVEQMRFGALVRGDTNPWSLEPIAGRIDPGETPETAARREAREEAGLELSDLVPTGRYYPSPGGVTEFLHTYVAIADLPDGAAAMGGLAEEDEDIRGVLLDMADAADFLASGEAQNAPLITSLQWLLLHRTRIGDPPRDAGTT